MKSDQKIWNWQDI